MGSRMKRGNVLVEQVCADGNVVTDYDQALSPVEILNVLQNYFPNVKKDANNIIVCEYEGKKFSVRIKNITYLGIPHPTYKKRIQISDDLQNFYRVSQQSGYTPLLMGIYSYCSNYIFCDFDIEDYINKKAHNSSAHVMLDDLQAATVDQFFQKVDYFGNHITIFSRSAVRLFFEDKLNADSDKSFEQLIKLKDKVTAEYEGQLEVVTDEIELFFNSLNKQWLGIDAYKEMIAANYHNKFQPEWAGFYLEYCLERYIEEKNLCDTIRFAQDKTEKGIDLDLFFPKLNAYGDLKAHSNHSAGIQGNDWGQIFNLLQGDTYSNHIYYVVCTHDTNKDSDYDYETTLFWNEAQHKANPMSYSKRMKHDVTLECAHVLDINPSNCKYLSMFKQGINSDGKPRNPKIMIDTNTIEHFTLKKLVF